MIRALPILLLFAACAGPSADPETIAVPNVTHRDDLAQLYAEQQLSGSFILHDMGRDHWIMVDSAQADSATLPASSFKIFSSLYGLESGLVSDADEVFPWDGNDYGRVEVNRDLDLREAMRVSAYWVHRDIARRAGPAVLKRWLDTIPYGNADTTGGYDRAWVRGNLLITPREQVLWLGRMLRGELPFSERSISIVKDITLQEDTLAHRLHGKTGWAMGDFGSVGWFIGWVEMADGSGPHVFANRVMTRDTTSATFAPARKAIAVEMLKQVGVLP
jgi:beta-lactamase class D